MNILVIGNGFDLAHGLPTKYTDFLEFCKMVSKIYEDEKINLHLFEEICMAQCNLNEEIKKQLLNVFESRKDHRDINTNNSGVVHTFTTEYPRTDELYELIKNNLWIEYFLPIYKSREQDGKNGWIDFESEISGVIQSLDDDMHGLSHIYNIEDNVYDLSNSFLKEKYSHYITVVRPKNPVDNGLLDRITYKEIRNKLIDDLNRLIRAFEIYLCDYVEKIEIEKKSPDIDKLNIDFILSFNYTHTFLKVYDFSCKSKHEVSDSFDYIHGETNANNTIEANNMVIGIDEYLSEDRKNKDIDFIAFKKFYQRIYKQTGCKYKKLVKQFQNKYNVYCEFISSYMSMISDARKKGDYLTASQWNDKMNEYIEKYNIDNIYIFGHSLDVTDKDILRDLILNDNVHTIIFYHNKDVMGQQIANLVKVIGQDELIRRTGGNTKTIEFKLQKPMEEIKQKDL